MHLGPLLSTPEQRSRRNRWLSFNGGLSQWSWLKRKEKIWTKLRESLHLWLSDCLFHNVTFSFIKYSTHCVSIENEPRKIQLLWYYATVTNGSVIDRYIRCCTPPRWFHRFLWIWLSPSACQEILPPAPLSDTETHSKSEGKKFILNV